jgi:hypothetical protein
MFSQSADCAHSALAGRLKKSAVRMAFRSSHVAHMMHGRHDNPTKRVAALRITIADPGPLAMTGTQLPGLGAFHRHAVTTKPVKNAAEQPSKTALAVPAFVPALPSFLAVATFWTY